MKRQASESKSGFRIDTFVRGKYYRIKNIALNLYMSADKAGSDENTRFQKQNSFDLQQIWMLQEVTHQNFQIIHPLSSMALEIVQNCVKIKPNKLKNSQTFYIDKSASNIQNNNSNVYLLKEFKLSRKCLFSQSDELKCQERALFKDQCHKWIIEPIVSHPLIKETCLVENFNSGLLISIHQSKQNQGQLIVQKLMANLFCQRWQFVKKNQYFVIKSLKTGMVLDINQEKMKQGNSVIQWKLKDSLNQLWSLEQHGKRIYLIRSAMDKNFVLSVKGSSLKDETELIITKQENQAFWRIVGPINF